MNNRVKELDNSTKKAIGYISCVIVIILLITYSFGGFNPESIIQISKNENSFTQNDDFCNTVLQNNDVSVITQNNKDIISHCFRQSARGGVVIEQSSRRVLIDEGMHVRCYPASTTKVLTALIVIERLPLDMIIKVPKEAVGVEGSSLYLKDGQSITVEDLLFGMMLRSGNDAATALAIAVSGSVDAFASLMNTRAKEVGAINSNFVNPHGLHDDNHYTTAYDLALITAKGYEYEDFRRFVDARVRKITVDGDDYHIANKNKLLNMFEGANGVKTGFTKTSGRCLIGGAKIDDMQLISVVLNYPDMWNDTIRMLKTSFDTYEMISLDKAMLLYPNAADICLIKFSQNVNSDWSDIKFPIRKDGSERLQIDASI